MLIRLPLVLSLASLLSTTLADRFPNDFTVYPKGAQACLNTADRNSGCNGETVPTMNACLCADGGGFVTDSAKCIGRSSPDDLETTYTMLQVNCDGSKTSMDISKDDWMKLGEEAQETSTPSATPTPTETGKPTNTPDPEDEDKQDQGGLSSGAKIGIAVGGTLLGVGIVAGLALFLYRRKKATRESKDEANPMLGRQSLQPSMFTGRESGSASVATTSVYGPPGYTEWKDPSQGNYSTAAWGPDSFSAGGNPTTVSPPPQQQWNTNESPAPSWNPQTGWGPQPPTPAQPQQPQGTAQPWLAPTGYHAVASQDGMAAGRDDPQNGVYELASTPADYRPRNALTPRPGPVEMPGSQP